jgi:enterochelin esterase-like enzyme
MKLRILSLVIFSFVSILVKAQSQIFTDSLFSKHLNEQRLITVYLPNGYDSMNQLKYPVIYTTDGQIINESYRHRMDSLIANKLVKPFVLIGSHSNETIVSKGMEMRNYDYLPGNPKIKSTYSDRFANHMEFFTHELVSYAESKYQISQRPEERTFYGISNGADFGISLALAHSDQFKQFILFSIFQGTKEQFKWRKKDGIYLYIGYGSKEENHVLDEAIRLKKYCIKQNISNILVTWDGAHERKQWELTFEKALIKMFPYED